MDSAKIFALGLAAGLAVHALMRSRGKQAQGDKGAKETSIAVKSSSKKGKGKKKKDTAAAGSAVVESKPKSEPVKEVSPPPVPPAEEAPAAQTTSQKKKNKKQKQSQSQSQQSNGNDSYAAVAETTSALNNDALRAKADAAQTAFTSSLGDMRDAEVDPLPAGYSSVARIPAAEVEASKPKLSKKELDDGWSSVGGTFSSNAGAKLNGSSSVAHTNGVAKASIASNNPFAALPDDATTSSVRRIPTKPTAKSNGTTNGSGWTVASASTKSKSHTNGAASAAETKKQRSNANKAQAKKAAKEEADRLQAERLANHRRQQANEAAKQREAAARPQPKSVPGSSKATSAKASVDLNGRLVWD